MRERNHAPPKRSWLTRLCRFLSPQPKDRAQLIRTLREAKERNLLSGEMLHMIESVIHVSEMQVRDVMVPKAQMVTIDKRSNLETILPLVIESGHSRFAVIDHGRDDVVGILLAKDLLRYCFEQATTPFDLNDIIRPAVFIPQSKRLDILLKEFRVNRNHLAIVFDEYGHVAGLVTIEDVLEQIVGDIEDEYDIDEDDEIRQHPDGSFIVKAATSIERFNAHFNTHFPDDEFDTIGGIVLQGFGHLPKRGETLTIENYHVKVLHSDNRRIYLLEVKKAEPPSD